MSTPNANTPPPNINPTPKQRFMSSKDAVAAHRSLMQRDDLQMSLDFALLEYQRRVVQSINDSMAGAGHLRIVGALEFLSTLKSLAESMPTPVLVDHDNLNQKA